MSELEIGHMVNRTGGRERVYVVIFCTHGPDGAPQTYTSEHSDYERLAMTQRAEVIDRAVEEHRHNLLSEHKVRCDCPMPEEFSVYFPYRSHGRLG